MTGSSDAGHPEAGRLRGKALAAGVLLAGLLITALLWRGELERGRERIDAALLERATLLAAQVQQRLVVYELALRGGASLFAATVRPTREQWAAYVAALALDEAYPGVQGVAFAAWTPRSRLSELEQAMRADGLPDFQVWPEAANGDAGVIVYIEPMDMRNRKALGFDMYSDPVRSRAMAASRDGNVPALTGPVELVQDAGDPQSRPAVLLYVPVYREDVATAPLAERREAFLGWVYAPFRSGDLMEGIPRSVVLPLRVGLTDVSGGEPRELYRDEGFVPATVQRGPSVQVPISFRGRQWQIEARPSPQLMADLDQGRPVGVLVAGLLVSLLLSAVIWSMSATRDRAHAIARSMTAALRRANDALDQRVAQRTAALVVANDRLRDQIAVREVAERARVQALEKEAQRNVQLQALADAALAISQLPDDTARFGYLAEQACRLVGCRYGVLVAFGNEAPGDEGSGRLAETGLGRVVPDDIDDGLRERMLARAAHWPRPAQAGRFELDDADREALFESAAMEAMAVPIRIAGGPMLGVLYLLAESGYRFGDEERAILVQLAVLTAAAVAIARAVDDERSARIEAENANAAKDHFLAQVSHELRTPLQAILGWIGVIERRCGDDTEQLRAAGIVRRNAEAQSALVEDLLDLVRIGQGRLRIDREPVDFEAVVRAVFESQHQQAVERGVTMTLETAGCHALDGDPLRLQQVVGNLLGNALKFTEAGGQVAIRLYRQGSWQVLEVADTGCGIAAEHIGQLFMPFDRGADPASGRRAGLGLGLSLVRHFVERHGGRVEALSPGEGQGSVFRVWLPAAGTGAGDRPATRSRRLVIVGNSDDSQRALAGWLASRGLEVIAFDAPQPALDWFDT
ncbi:MAG: CHASE domain-containing protein, partial [Burkholderiaceae bacterium]